MLFNLAVESKQIVIAAIHTERFLKAKIAKKNLADKTKFTGVVYLLYSIVFKLDTL